MAKPVKQLRDLLREKQEPFLLELYLLEKGYLKKRFDSRNVLRSLDPERGQKGTLMCSKVLRDVCSQVISFNGKLRIKNSNRRDEKDYEAPEYDRFSSETASSSTRTASDGEATSTSQQKEHITVTERRIDSNSLIKANEQAMRDRKLQCQCIEETSPVSVLEEVTSNRDNNGTKNLSSIEQKDGSIASTNSPRKITEDSIISASLWRILGQSASEETPEIQEIAHSNLSQPNIKQKKVVQQTRQLLFDCVTEIVETQERKKRKNQRKYFGTEDFGKLVEEKIKCWGKPYGEDLNSTHLLEMDFRDSEQEWISFKPIERRIGCEIGDAILEEMMNEIVVNLLDSVAI